MHAFSLTLNELKTYLFMNCKPMACIVELFHNETQSVSIHDGNAVNPHTQGVQFIELRFCNPR